MNRKKAKKIVGVTADVTAEVVGGVLRLGARALLTVLLVFLTSGLLFACIFAYYVKTSLSTELDVTLEEVSVSLSSTIWAKNSNGDYVELRTLSGSENRIWVDYENIPRYMEYAAVAIEDKRFYTHKGVDWWRTLGAFAGMFLTMENEFGGSTITQQLIKNVTDDDDATVQRKLLEIFRALEFEKTYTKKEIIEWYLNYVYFGQGCDGVQTAAQTYFGKDVWDLSLAECACIVGITNQPTAYNPFINEENNKKRQETILYEMYDQGYITYAEYEEAVNEELQFARGKDEVYEQEILSYYEEVLINDVIEDIMKLKNTNRETASRLLYSGGYQIYSSLDLGVQAQIDAVYEDIDNLPQSYYAASQQLQSAIVVMDPYTGEIKGLSGGVGEKTINYGLNRATGAWRPCGSSTKPLSVYGPALEYGLITQNTLVDDSPDIKLEGHQWWYPKNADWSYRGIVTIRQAIALSLNTVAAQIVDKLTPEESYKYMVNKLGFESLVEEDCAYAPLSMGQYTYGVTVREMAQAYCSFVNNGIFTESRTYTKITDAMGNVIIDNEPQTHIAWSENTAANICNMLQNAVLSGTGTSAYFNTTAVAGKTGTTSDNKDRYFCGFTEYYVAAVWTGYDTPEKMNFYGNPAIDLWKRVMQPLHEGLEYKNFPTPRIGQPTNIFGDLEDELEEQNKPKPTPTPTPTPT
ncbi:MAG: PBP1A family penicillin-binding protein, partial [Oscillospiraceae bacterium]|nr:PBP1A family penicillin-binding protein [Oscillospiraceae bacterium]